MKWPTFQRSTPEQRKPDDWTLYSTDGELELLLSITAQEPKGREALTPEREPSSWALPILRRLHIQARWRRRKVQRAAATAAAALTATPASTASDTVGFGDWLVQLWPTATASLRSSLSAIAGKLGADLPKAPPLRRAMRRTRSVSPDAGGGDRSTTAAPHTQARATRAHAPRAGTDATNDSAESWVPVGESSDSLRNKLRAALDDARHWH